MLGLRPWLGAACGRWMGWPEARNLGKSILKIRENISALFPLFPHCFRNSESGGRDGRELIDKTRYSSSHTQEGTIEGGLRGMFSEARGCLLTQRRHLAPCRKRDAFPARQRYKIFYSIQIFFLHGEGVGGLRPVGWVFGCLACGQF